VLLLALGEAAEPGEGEVAIGEEVLLLALGEAAEPGEGEVAIGEEVLLLALGDSAASLEGEVAVEDVVLGEESATVDAVLGVVELVTGFTALGGVEELVPGAVGTWAFLPQLDNNAAEATKPKNAVPRIETLRIILMSNF